MAPLSVALGDYVHTRALRAALDRDGDGDFRFHDYGGVGKVYAAFGPMVRERAFDICELAIGTFFQAREAGIPLTLLPIVMSGDTHHHSINRSSKSPTVSPRGLAGRRVAVRAYSQTSGLWARGILHEQFGLDPGSVTWTTAEAPHVPGVQEPPNVVRVQSSVAELILTGQVAAALVVPGTIDIPGVDLIPVIPDPDEAAQEWIDRHRTIPINHMLVVRSELLQTDRDRVETFYRALADAIHATVAERAGTKMGRAVSAGWSDAVARCLEVAAAYAVDQRLITRRVDVGRLIDESEAVAA